MLVLSRKQGETLVVGGNIRITVVRVDGSRVKIGIDAPEDVRVVRGELTTRPQSAEAAQAEAAQAEAAQAQPNRPHPDRVGADRVGADRVGAGRADLASTAQASTHADALASASPIAKQRAGRRGPLAARGTRRDAVASTSSKELPANSPSFCI